MSVNDENNLPQLWAIIPAAGKSLRMDAGIPKSYLPLGSSTVIESSLSCFLHEEKIKGIVIALHPNDRHWQNLSIRTAKPIFTVVGGDTRAQSVSIALNKVLELSNPEDFALVHDAARPCLDIIDLNLLINNCLLTKAGGILATPVVDTIKESISLNSEIKIKHTIERQHLWKALTPQMFRVDILHKALNYCFENKINITDEASAVEALGMQVNIIEGRSDNIKITLPADILVAESILSNLNKRA